MVVRRGSLQGWHRPPNAGLWFLNHHCVVTLLPATSDPLCAGPSWTLSLWFQGLRYLHETGRLRGTGGLFCGGLGRGGLH